MIKLRKRKLKDGVVSFYLDIYYHGQRTYETLNIKATKQDMKEKKQLAENIRAKREIELVADDYDLTATHKRRQNFVQFFERVARNKGHNTYSNLKSHLLNFTGGYIEFRQVNSQWINQFSKYLLKKVSQNTTNQYMTCLRVVINVGIREGFFKVSPFLNAEKIRKIEKERIFLTIEEVQRLSEASCPNLEAKRAFLFSCFTGLRYSDIVRLTPKDVVGNNLHIRIQKTGRIEHIPMSTQAKAFLNKDVIYIDKLFDLPTLEAINSNLVKLAKDAKIEKHITFHSGRHTFATMLLTEGNDIYTVSKLLGHTNLSATQIYAKIIDEKKVEAVNRLPELKKKG